jgi:cytochrome c1
VRGFRGRLEHTGTARHWRAAALAACATLVAALSGCGEEVKPLRVPGGEAERGKALMSQYQCGSCHAIPGEKAATGTAGPPLDTFGRRSYIAGHIPNQPDNLVRWLRDPPALVPGTPMPKLGLTEDEARHMAAYLYTLK